MKHPAADFIIRIQLKLPLNQFELIGLRSLIADESGCNI